MTMAFLHRIKTFDRDVRLYLLASAMLGLGYYGLYAALFNLYLLRLGYGPEFIGSVNGVGLLASAVFGLPAGALGRRWGTRSMMVVGLVSLVVSNGFIPLAQYGSDPVRGGLLLVATSVGWMGGTLFMVNGTPFLMGSTTPEERPHAFSVMTALFPLGGFLGSMVGGQLPGLASSLLRVSLDSPMAFGYPLFTIPLAYAVGLFAILGTHQTEIRQTEEAAASAGTVPYAALLALALVIALHSASETTARVFLSMYLDASLGASTALIGMVLGVGQLLSVPAVLVVPLLVKSLGRRHTVMAGSLVMGCFLLPLALVPHWMPAGLGFLGAIAMSGIWYAAITMYHQEVVQVHWRAVVSGVASTAMSVGMAGISFGGGHIIGSVGYRSLFLLGVALAASAALVFWVCLRGPKGAAASVSDSVEAT
jgi:MFS family permease